ncbi:MAG: Holliday junction branch migration DNA helicase RuvB [Micrococcales bacterium]
MSDVTNPDPIQSELAFESSLRPQSLEEFVGQETVRQQVSLILEAARIQSRTADHMLFAGPPGLGKTTLAMIVANEAQSNLRLTSGPTIQHAGDLAAILSSLVSGDVLFIDEIHRMSRSVEEMLYLAMEDFRIDIMVGKGPGATSVPLELEPFTLIGATTRSGLLASPLRDRFGFTANMEFYSDGELVRVIQRAAGKLAIELVDDGALAIASRSRGTPRIANRLLRRVRDFALVQKHAQIDANVASKALKVFEVDEFGLDRLDRDVLTLLCTQFASRPVGLATIAVAVGEEQDTIESVVEPFLVRTGLVSRTSKGREATSKAYAHLGLTSPISGQTPLFDL